MLMAEGYLCVLLVEGDEVCTPRTGIARGAEKPVEIVTEAFFMERCVLWESRE